MRKNLLLWGVVALVILAGVGAVVWLFGTKKLVFDSNPERTRLMNVSVCNEDVVSRYNKASFITTRSETSVDSRDEKALDAIFNEISAKPDYSDDATCQTMLALRELDKSNRGAARAAYDNVKRLYDFGVYANSNIYGSYSISDLDTYTGATITSNEDSESVE